MNMKINWLRKIYSNGRHNMCVGNIVKWHDTYYIGFVDCLFHGSNDAQAKIISSTDLESWSSHIAMGKTSFDPQLIAFENKLLLYAVRAA